MVLYLIWLFNTISDTTIIRSAVELLTAVNHSEPIGFEVCTDNLRSFTFAIVFISNFPLIVSEKVTESGILPENGKYWSIALDWLVLSCVYWAHNLVANLVEETYLQTCLLNSSIISSSEHRSDGSSTSVSTSCSATSTIKKPALKVGVVSPLLWQFQIGLAVDLFRLSFVLVQSELSYAAPFFESQLVYFLLIHLLTRCFWTVFFSETSCLVLLVDELSALLGLSIIWDAVDCACFNFKLYFFMKFCKDFWDWWNNNSLLAILLTSLIDSWFLPTAWAWIFSQRSGFFDF